MGILPSICIPPPHLMHGNRPEFELYFQNQQCSENIADRGRNYQGFYQFGVPAVKSFSSESKSLLFPKAVVGVGDTLTND